MTTIDSSLLTFIESQLHVATRRQETLTANIANSDTPGYIAQDVSFSEKMQMLNTTTTSPIHITSPGSDSQTRTFDVGTDVKPNGNSVDLDRELTEVTTNGLEFITLMQYLQHKFRTLRSSISEGGNG